MSLKDENLCTDSLFRKADHSERRCGSPKQTAKTREMVDNVEIKGVRQVMNVEGDNLTVLSKGEEKIN